MVRGKIANIKATKPFFGKPNALCQSAISKALGHDLNLPKFPLP